MYITQKMYVLYLKNLFVSPTAKLCTRHWYICTL